ncbi:hypothetical protein C8Q74DRAFT_951757 [Fomes fomentarius]|nr:hypothetical protein C8Q74DRAFT_951757 [Fomes fomentarius]
MRDAKPAIHDWAYLCIYCQWTSGAPDIAHSMSKEMRRWQIAIALGRVRRGPEDPSPSRRGRGRREAGGLRACALASLARSRGSMFASVCLPIHLPSSVPSTSTFRSVPPAAARLLLRLQCKLLGEGGTICNSGRWTCQCGLEPGAREPKVEARQTVMNRSVWGRKARTTTTRPGGGAGTWGWEHAVPRGGHAVSLSYGSACIPR